MPLRLGKRPAAPRDTDLKLARYRVSTGDTAPERFGFDGFIPTTAWGMLGNDEWGCCAWSGPAHEHMLLTGGNHRSTSMAQFTTENVLADYASTGFDPAQGPPGDNPTDQGTDVHQGASYRRHTGIIDATGTRHLIGAYVWLEPGNWDELVQAIYDFETVGIGIEFPESAMGQFDEGVPWDVVPGSRIEDGHYVNGTGRTSADRIHVVTWGKRITMTRAFYERYNDESLAYIAPDILDGERSLRGFDMDKLNSDLAGIGG